MMQSPGLAPGTRLMLRGSAAATVAFLVNLFPVPEAVRWGVWALLLAGVLAGVAGSVALSRTPR